ncbi:MAG: zinc-binding alcohol dehydrogenase family protein [Actinobacteria bacterium]|nr:MAG: zinc-binding alcohol dehydrogenase family protein [Actinomycetota bacterium]TML47891.1 MAG: zinc-binding alcohol dehydrogenase family protein [Actinomycetota bacterium]TML73327.1 MAG: zinc-binding alcohol dehydrogenase family protein [Actinomycetota bacterium]
MRGVQIAELGATPELAEIDGDGSVAILAVGLNPLDLAVAAGRFYGGHPPFPYVPGCEAVGRIDGQRVHLFGDGRGTIKDGFLVERVTFPEQLVVPVPDGLDDAAAAVCGIAGIAGWGPVARRAPVRPDDRVLVLAATGTVGSIALQGARALGAARVVAAGRDETALERTLELGADATVALEGSDLAARMREACGGDGPTLVVDPLWGEPARAATEAAAPGARIVQLGQSAGPEATFASSIVRGKQLSILGYSVFGLPPQERREAYLGLAEQVAAGRISIDVETFSLDQVAAAWSAQASGAKAVVVL